ncbi:extracellular matrix-binding ebh [Babesia caballi]|uniref:Extracellular matrix-binding ebh n=1 Tax=Babesia caballi TaxID=5871 RepID=A0AAV4LMQ0_BABCB|nr:extracellular matrix-binding ebh [Babesia caballi]
MLSGYTYALQFQLYFLYAQCYSTYSLGSGWRACRYGSGVNSSTNGKRVTSHICSAGCNKSSNGHTISSHSGAKCTHNDCGTSDNQSPLQAFLIDNLKGFTHSLPGSPSHLSNHPTSSMCHVRMGFHPEHLRHNAGTGNYIYSALASFCSGPDTPLRQLCEKLGCLTKRAPRSLGDLFGFIWHLNYQLFNSAQILDKLKEALRTNSNSVEDFIEKLKKSLPSLPSSAEDSGLVKSLKAMASIIPFLYQLFMVKPDEFLPVTLFNVVQHCHKVEHSNNIIKIVHKDSSDSSLTSGHNCSSSPNDLWSLCQPVGPAPGGGEDAHAACRGTNCGGYLYSLTHSDGATYAPAYAPVYLSWVSYLVDDLETGLQELFDVFKGLNCSGCTKCVPGSHGSSKDSPCPSIVDCDGVLPLLYRHGFQFYDARWLKGMKSENKNGQWEWTQNDHLKRTCNKFSSQVQSVLSPYAPLATLLESIDSFLYMFRFYFFYNLSSFWLCSLAILLYFIFYGIDVLHVKSHVHLPSSHTVPPIGLLTTGKAPALTKLTYYMP